MEFCPQLQNLELDIDARNFLVVAEYFRADTSSKRLEDLAVSLSNYVHKCFDFQYVQSVSSLKQVYLNICIFEALQFHTLKSELMVTTWGIAFKLIDSVLVPKVLFHAKIYLGDQRAGERRSTDLPAMWNTTEKQVFLAILRQE